jgi:UDP-N-acetylmuramyl pentapeptide phosphotransferase/UDP-N-acetylglucosamine-1-phosphate transferase
MKITKQEIVSFIFFIIVISYLFISIRVLSEKNKEKKIYNKYLKLN